MVRHISKEVVQRYDKISVGISCDVISTALLGGSMIYNMFEKSLIDVRRSSLPAKGMIGIASNTYHCRGRSC